jgi:C4-dicarboxylate-specific signal transduction histidine kinase
MLPLRSAADVLFIAALILLVAEAAIIVALLVERIRRRRAEAQNRAMLSSMAADLAIVGNDGCVETCTDNWSRSRKQSNPFTSATIGELWLDGGGVPSENTPDLLRLRDALAAVLGGEAPERIVEYAWGNESQRRWSHLRVRQLDRPEGGVVVAIVDISARKRMEEDTRRALHDLAHLNMRADMGQLVSTITHELNQPITASLGNIQAMRRMLAANRVAVDELMSIVNDVHEANRRAADLIGRIRAQIRKEPLDVRPIDLNPIVDEVVQLLNSSAADGGVRLVTELDRGLPAIIGDHVQLRQVVMNLILNAVQAMHGHPTTVPAVRVITSTQGGVVSLTVEDAGPGVAEATRHRLFEPYFTTKKEGLGVGLSISQSIVESHGGRIEVANLPQGGAKFSVIFPMH